ncbi:hypothetical protein EYF80_046850 [Liparis tanakae]|uniref:Uncharacterized protein n=1 Tax=Liparis tanakae TaxID=230148 RepID=A0A4Z2FQ07_9TELE|nr:hypothetical protein EYF80_046850 [Liparis tanakae]
MELIEPPACETEPRESLPGGFLGFDAQDERLTAVKLSVPLEPTQPQPGRVSPQRERERAAR